MEMMRTLITRTARYSIAGLVLAALAAVAAVSDAPLPVAPATVAAQADPNVLVDPRAYQDLRWRSVGPHRGGRVTAYAGVRTQPNVFYMGATGGGVWKTENYGITWHPVSDGQIATGSIGSIDVADSNPSIVWVGTGSAAIRSNVIIGRGVYKSTDAGSTWQFMGLRDSGQIGSVVIHPTNPDIVWVAALGSPFGPNEERGIFKTTDGGRTWRKVLFVDNETGGRDLAINWSNPDEIYAAMYRGFRKGWDIISGGPADKGGIYKSTDGGSTWTKLSAGLPQRLIGKIDIDVARSNPKVVYAMVEAPGAEGGLYRSDDAGATWRLVNSDQRLRARPFYFHYVTVHPKDENEVWVNELRLHRSTDGGKTFAQVETPHGDNHGMWFNPDNPSIILQVNDGGANVSQDGGRSWSSILNQPTAELYMVSVDEQHPYRLYAPQQDNSTIIVPSVPDVSWGYDHQAQSWVQGPGCETGQIHPRPDGQVIWGVCKGEIGRYSLATGQEQHYWVYPQNRYGHDPDEIRYRFPRQSVILISPHDPKVVYHASHVVHRTTDEGVTWETISPDLTAREPDKQIVSGNPITRDITGEEVYSSIYAMNESRLERGVLWVGANDGPVHVSRDGGKSWQNVTPKDLAPGGRVQTIEPSPHRKGSAYIAVYRFLREHDLQPYIYKTEDYGRTWTRLTTGKNGIPADHPTRVVREDPEVPGLLYAGTEFGFFVSFDDGKHWQALQQNLPATPVTDLRVHRGDLVISTMGRSFWIMDDISPLRQIARGLRAAGTASAMRRGGGGETAAGAGPSAADGAAAARGPAAVATAPAPAASDAFSASAPAYLFAPRPAYRMRYAASMGEPGRPEYPPAGAYIDYYFASEPAGDVTLEIVDGKGAVVRSFTSAGPAPRSGSGQEMRMALRFGLGGPSRLPKRAGMNRFLWDLRYAGPWSAQAPAGGPGGPHVVPGRYQVRLTAGGTTLVREVEVRIDPRVTASGVTEAHLAEQLDLLLKVRDAISEGRRLQEQLSKAMEAAGVKPPPAPGPGETPGTVKYAHPLQAVWARLVTAPGPYPQPMLLDQFANIARMLGQADQKPGKDAWDRYNDLMKELAAVKAEAAKLMPAAGRV
jgi:photosystem II stability/assembly factor-like uncharacterized protein